MSTTRQTAGKDTPRTVIAAVCLAVVVLGVYAGVRDHGFVDLDDNEYVFENTMVRRGLTAEGLEWALTGPHAFNWHPLTWLSHMADCELFGLHAGRHHLTSVVLHAANAVLLLLALFVMTRAFWPAVVVAALFALHPLRVESVAWISERKDVLSGSFWMLTLLAYAAYARRPGAARYTLVLVCLALGLMAKPMLVTLPFVLLLLDYWPLGRWRLSASRGASEGAPHGTGVAPGRLLLEKVPLLSLAVASSAITIVAQRTGALKTLDLVPFGSRVANALVAYVAYLWKSVWPSGLAVFYPHPALVGPERGSWLGAVAAAIALGAVTFIVLRSVRTRPYLAVGWLWYLGALVPVIGIFQVGNQAMADRYTYLPLIGVYVMLAWGAAGWLGNAPRMRTAVAVVVVLALAAFTTVSWRQVGYWRDSIALFEHAIAVTSDNFLAHNNLGRALSRQGRQAEAEVHFRRALEIKPDYGMAHYNLGRSLQKRGDLAPAVTHYEQAVLLRPGYVATYNNLGIALLSLGDVESAKRILTRAVELSPSLSTAHFHLGKALAREGAMEAAAARYERAIEIRPSYADAHLALAGLALEIGDLQRAAQALHRVTELQPDYVQGHYRYGNTLGRLGRTKEAVASYRRALQGRPAPMGAARQLAWILATSTDASVRDGDEAVRWAEQCAIATENRDPSVLNTLAAAYAEVGDFDSAVRYQKLALDLAAASERQLFRARVAQYEEGRPLRVDAEN